MPTRAPTAAIIGSGPMALVTALEFVRSAPDKTEAGKPERLIIISKEPEEKLGYGELMDTVHDEVLLTTPAGNMWIDPAYPGEFIDYLKRVDIGVETLERIARFNHSPELEKQFVPRVLLHPLAQRAAEALRKEATRKGIDYQYIQGEAIGIKDNILPPDKKFWRHCERSEATQQRRVCGAGNLCRAHGASAGLLRPPRYARRPRNDGNSMGYVSRRKFVRW